MDVRSRGFPTLVQMMMLLCLLLLAVVQAELEYADSTEAVVAVAAEGRSKRSSIVFRPLFATRERQAERADRQDAWRRYWDSERSRQQYNGRKGYQGYQG